MRKNTSLHYKLQEICNFCTENKEDLFNRTPSIYICSSDEIIGLINYISFTEQINHIYLHHLGFESDKEGIYKNRVEISGNCSLARFDQSTVKDFFEVHPLRQLKPFDIIINPTQENPFQACLGGG
jgi:hypothetical protein